MSVLFVLALHEQTYIFLHFYYQYCWQI